MAKFDSIPGAGRFSQSTLNKVYRRGLGAFYSSGSRPGQSAHSWAMGRVKSLSVARVARAKLIRIY